MAEALRVGLVGTGPWAKMAHGPILTGGPETELVGVWGRRTEAAEEIVSEFGGKAFADYDAMLDECDAVAFAVPPDVQGDMAIRAAQKGKHLLLDKPVGATVEQAERLAGAVADAGVMTLVVLSMRFSTAIRRFLPMAAELEPAAASYESLHGAFLDGPFSNSPWRHEGGVLPDIGPHVVDLLTTILGPAKSAAAQAERQIVRLSIRHENGGFSHAVLSAHHTGTPVQSLRAYSPTAVVDCDWDADESDRWGIVRRELVATVRTGVAHPCDVHRGVELERVLAMAKSHL